jgi:hypothetical protein
METVNIYNIYMHLARFYSVRKFVVKGIMKENRFKPSETIIDFFIPTNAKINIRRLNRILEREIKWVNYTLIIDEFKIRILVTHKREKSIMEYDLESRLN